MSGNDLIGGESYTPSPGGETSVLYHEHTCSARRRVMRPVAVAETELSLQIATFPSRVCVAANPTSAARFSDREAISDVSVSCQRADTVRPRVAAPA